MYINGIIEQKNKLENLCTWPDGRWRNLLRYVRTCMQNADR